MGLARERLVMNGSAITIIMVTVFQTSSVWKHTLTTYNEELGAKIYSNQLAP